MKISKGDRVTWLERGKVVSGTVEGLAFPPRRNFWNVRKDYATRGIVSRLATRELRKEAQ